MSAVFSILVVEDDAALRAALVLALECAGHGVVAADGGAAALAALQTQRFGLVVSDLRMAPMDGLQLLGRIRAAHPGVPVLLMTAYGDVPTAVQAMQGGACDFLVKPFEPRTLLAQVARYARAPAADDGLVAADVRTHDVLALAERVAASEATVLLLGESGVGKEVFARHIHARSARAAGPFVAVNCAAIPDSLLEATLFGYEKGAFTGAASAQPGKFEQAQGGSLLLDEISEMPLALQAKLLRVLQEREVERVGARAPVRLDIRVLATSNRDMAQEVAAGRFREDLYFRLAVFPLHIPALRERADDIVPLARMLLERYAGATPAVLGEQAQAALRAYAWPGNVRELANTVQRAAILAGGGNIEPVHLQLGSLVPSVPRAAAPEPPVAPTSAAPRNMRELERQHILDTLQAVGGSRKLAVQRLGISERTLRYKLQQWRAAGMI